MLLAQVESEFLHQHDEQLEMVEASGWLPWNPGSAYVDDQAALVSQDTLETLGEGPEPIAILVCVLVAVALLPDQAEGRTGHDQIDRRPYPAFRPGR